MSWRDALGKLLDPRLPDISLFHKFHRPPFGGGNQFLLALRSQFLKDGYRIETNKISASSRSCLFNSFNFKRDVLQSQIHSGCRMVHRVDGPISLYRGSGLEIDQGIRDINDEVADATVFQSHYSQKAHEGMDLSFTNPVVITNAVDLSIFSPAVSRRPSNKIRLISTSWSDNPRKGAATYKWLEGTLDWKRFEYTFVGRSAEHFDRIRTIRAQGSRKLARILTEHDVYVTASENDPCSNALIEALSCGLPTIYLRSGGHPEIVGDAGWGFGDKEELVGILDRVPDEIGVKREAIRVPSLAETAKAYLKVMGLSDEDAGT
jgi:glycosyltransferase involved in cell wall biosynthesis